jgi:hypothetical protein
MFFPYGRGSQTAGSAPFEGLGNSYSEGNISARVYILVGILVGLKLFYLSVMLVPVLAPN